MDRPPGWIKVVAASCWAIGLIAATSGPAPFVWRPSVQDRWVWPTATLSTVDSPVAVGPADVVVLDPFVFGEATVSDLHTRGRAAVCRLSGGVWEAGRPDEARLDPLLVGPGGWLDIRHPEPIAAVLADRLALCVTKGFDGVVLTDLDGYAQLSGFPLTVDDQHRYNTALVDLAHHSGLRVAVIGTRSTPLPSEVDVVVAPPR